MLGRKLIYNCITIFEKILNTFSQSRLIKRLKSHFSSGKSICYAKAKVYSISLLLYVLFTGSMVLNASSLLGDINSDGVIDVVDAMLAAQYSVGIIPVVFDATAADVNCNQLIDMVDALLIAQYSVDLIAQFPCAVPLTPTPTATVLPTPTTTQNIKIVWAGTRSSGYGIRPFPDSVGWANAMNTMAGYFPGSTPTGVWLIGEVDFDGSGMLLEFPRPNDGINYGPLYVFSNTDKHESYLTYFDTHGIKVFLQVEPGFADMNILIDLVLNRYQHHPCVIGFGVDVEWYRNASDGGSNAKCTDALAKSWETRVKQYNSTYRLFVKHYDRSNLPPTYRGDIIFIDDSEQNGSYSSFLSEMKGFADFFYPSDVMFQIGYPSDKSFWSKLTVPIPQTMGNDLANQIKQRCGIIWVDFSLRDVLPAN